MEQAKNNNNLIKLIGIGIVSALVAYFLVTTLLSGKAPTIDPDLQATADGINKSTPTVMVPGTQLDSVEALPGNIFRYTYTLLEIDKADVAVKEMKDSIEPGMITSIKTDPDMKNFRDKKVVIEYIYKDKNGKQIMTIAIGPDKYGN